MNLEIFRKPVEYSELYRFEFLAYGYGFSAPGPHARGVWHPGHGGRPATRSYKRTHKELRMDIHGVIGRFLGGKESFLFRTYGVRL